jgi:hypothetical protein
MMVEHQLNNPKINGCFEDCTEFYFITSDSTVPLVLMKQPKDYDFFVSFVARLLG